MKWLHRTLNKSDMGGTGGTIQSSDYPPDLLDNIHKVSLSMASPSTNSHSWDALATARAESSPAAATPSAAATSVAAPIGQKSTIESIMEHTAAYIMDLPPQYMEHVLVRTEHYFRLVVQAWEQLQACHYKASQKFSLAEWMYIHALLLYGRIQAVRKHVVQDQLSQYNRIDLSADLAIFEPLAAALNAIGVVKDHEIGIMYVPDAVFPAESGSAASAAYTALEMRHLLNSTMYDWQRNWKHVLEEREQRKTQFIKFRLTRSPSELISAIQEKTDMISHIRRGEEGSNSHSRAAKPTDYESKLEELNALLEEARNAKDYTLRPPYAPEYSHINSDYYHNSLDPHERGSFSRLDGIAESSPAEGNDHPDYSKLAIAPGSSPSTNKPAAGTGGITTALDDPSDAIPGRAGSQATKKSAMRKSQTCFVPETSGSSDLESGGEPLGPLEGFIPFDGLNSSAIHNNSNSNNSSDTSYDNSSTSTSSNNASNDTSPNSSVDVMFERSLKNLGSRLVSSMPTRARTDNSPTPQRSTRKVQLAVSADSSSLFVHFDVQIWEEYQNFVDALQATKLARFGTLKQAPEGTYAWLIPVKVGKAGPSSVVEPTSARGPYSHLQPVEFSQNQPDLSASPATAGQPQILELRLPRASVPKQDQAMALALQMSGIDREISDSWHAGARTELDLRKFILNYVNAGILDPRAL